MIILAKKFRQSLCVIVFSAFILGGSISPLLAQTATINQLEVVNPDSNFTNDPMFLVESHENDGNALTVNHEFIVETDVTYHEAGNFRLLISLLDESNVSVLTEEVLHGSISINDNRKDSTPMQAGAGNYLDPKQKYRVRVIVQKVISILPTVWKTWESETEATGRHYFHFNNLNSSDLLYNVISHVDAVGFGTRKYVIDSVAGRESFPVYVDYTLFRWDQFNSFGVAPVRDFSVTLEYRLFQDDGTPVALSGTSTPDPLTEKLTFTVEDVAAWEAQPGYRRPSTTSGLRVLHVNPAEILKSNSHEHYVSVRISHVELLSITGNELRTADQRIPHFSGALDFYGIPTTITGSGLAPVAIAPNSPFFDFNSVSGHIDGFPTHTFNNEIIRAGLDETDGSLDYNTFQGPVTINGPPVDVAEVGGISFIRSGLQLKLNGLFAEVSAKMPPGSGYTTSLKSPILSQLLNAQNIQLNSNLVPAGDIDFVDSKPFYVNEESKPVWIHTPTIRWSPGGGTFKFPNATVQSIRRPLIDALEDANDLGQLVQASMAVKRSNDHAYNSLNSVLPEPSITPNPVNKSAELNASISLSPGSMITHHPYSGIVAWGNPGTVNIVADKINTTTSFLNNVTLVVPYYQHCPDCENAQVSTKYVFLSPDNDRLIFTENGGLHGKGDLGANANIGWGRIGNVNPVRNAHQTMAGFQRGNFFMIGHAWPSLLGIYPASVQALAAPLVHRNFLAAGIDPANLTSLHFPGSANFNSGAGDYAGINTRVSGVDANIQMTSMLGGSATAPYNLKPNSKFYMRLSGVSGVQDAVDTFNPPASTLFGYPVDFSSFGLSWLSNVNIHSRTNGTLSLPPPSDFDQDFAEMKFSCLGAPTVVPPTGLVDKELTYWKAPFTILSMQFLTDNGCAPDAGNTCLAVGVSMNARFVDVPLFGTLGFNQNGQIITPGENRCGITSRFPLPSSIEITGPKKPGASDEYDAYVMNPVQEAYLNSESSDARQGPDHVGYWNLAGTVDVPFFEDLQVQVHTEATAESPVIVPMYVQGGWKDGDDETAFSIDMFDGSHDGHPGAGADTYRIDIAFGPHAKRRWYGLLDFDYPLEWSPTGRRFGSPNQPDINLIVASVEHRLNFLTPRRADLSFGVEYEGIPRINLSNYVLDAVDSGSGIAQSLIDAAGEEVFGTLEGGLDSLAGALASQADEFIGGVVDAAMDSALDDFTDALVTAVSTGNATITEVVDTHIRPQASMQRGVNPPISPLGNVVAEIIGDGQNLVGIELKIDSVLVDAQRAIDSLVGVVSIDPLTGLAIPPVPGIFKDVAGTRQGALNLVNSLITNLAPDFTNVLNNSAASEIIDDAEAAFSQIEAALLEIRQTITETRARLGAINLPEIPDTDFLDQLRDLRSLLEIELRTDILDIVADRIDAYLNELLDEVVNTLPNPADVEAYMDDLKDEIKQRIRDEIRDQLFSGEVIAEIQEAIRDRLRLVHLAMREAIDEAFGEVNKVIRELISETLAGVDNSLNDAVSKINEVIKTGRIQGHALINQDGLDELSLSALVQMGIPKDDPFEFDGFMRIKRIQTQGPAGCTAPPGTRVSEITLGARGVPIRWFDSGADATISATFGVQTEPTVRPVGLGGSIELEGELDFEGFQVTELAGALKIGSLPNAQNELELNEYYAAFSGRARMSGTELAAGFYAGRTCSIEPLVMVDPEAAALIGNPPFTGVYLYGEGRIPIVDFGCAFRVSAGVGMGAFYFSQGPTYGGRMVLSASGEALCTVSVRGEISLTGLKQGNDYRFSGRGRISGKAGPCPFCIRFKKTVRATYDGGWDVDY